MTAARPRRGAPEATRRRLVDAAARELERAGYHGTDTNRIARAAGYAPGTFYKHFADKRAVFLAVYEAWVSAEWATLARLQGGPALDARARAARITAFLVAHHRRFRGFRASLRALVATDPTVRRFHRAQRRRQLRLLGATRPAARRADGALLVLLVERVCDAIADGELPSLGLSEVAARAHLTERIAAFLAPAP